jgi:hypothetical protein
VWTEDEGTGTWKGEMAVPNNDTPRYVESAIFICPTIVVVNALECFVQRHCAYLNIKSK